MIWSSPAAAVATSVETRRDRTVVSFMVVADLDCGKEAVQSRVVGRKLELKSLRDVSCS